MRSLAALREAALLELGPLLRRCNWTVAGNIDVGHGGGVLFVVIKMAAEGCAAENGLDELVLTEGFGEVVLWT